MNWDQYFLNLCNAVGENSKCHSRKIGSVLVKGKNVVATGYNGPPAGVPHCENRYELDSYLREQINVKGIKISDHNTNVCPRRLMGYASGQGLDICIAVHSERNCLLSAAKNGISTAGTTMYMNCPISCKDCFIEIINAGVEEIVVTSLEYYDPVTKYLVENSRLRVRQFEGI